VSIFSKKILKNFHIFYFKLSQIDNAQFFSFLKRRSFLSLNVISLINLIWKWLLKYIFLSPLRQIRMSSFGAVYIYLVTAHFFGKKYMVRKSVQGTRAEKSLTI